MRVPVPFGDTVIEAVIPDRATVLKTTPHDTVPAIADLPRAVGDALASPLESLPISALVKPDATVTIAFDDGTTPSFGPLRGIAIEAVLLELEKAGVPRRTVRLVCANALHRKFRREELARLIGADLVREFGDRLGCHDAEDPDNLCHLGRTSGGYDVEVNPLVAESDLTVYINTHHTRGFNGGWKSVCVGLSTWRSIRHHHNPDGMSMSVDNNRMHAMLDEMGHHLEAAIPGKLFKIDALESGPLSTSHVFAGSVWACRRAVLEVQRRRYPPRREQSGSRFDVVLYGVPDASPYTVFSFSNPILTLISSGLGYLGGTIDALGKPGCTVILATPCPERWDRVHHPSYPIVWEKVLSKTRDPYEIQAKFAEDFATDGALIQKYRREFAFHPIHGILATHPLKRLKFAGRVIVAGIQNPRVAEHLGFTPSASIEQALGLAAEVHGANYSLIYAEHPAAPTKVAL